MQSVATPSGIRGWLLVFLILQTASTLIFTIPPMVSGLRDAPEVAAWAGFGLDGYNIFWHYIVPILYAGIWTAYLLTSRRVANTYDRAGANGQEPLDKVFE